MFWQLWVQMTTTFICFKQCEGSALPQPPHTLVLSNVEVLHPLLPLPTLVSSKCRSFAPSTTTTSPILSNAEVLHPLPPPLHSFRATQRFYTLTTTTSPILSNVEVLHPLPTLVSSKRRSFAPSTTNTSPPPLHPFWATQRFCTLYLHSFRANTEVLHPLPPTPSPPRLHVSYMQDLDFVSVQLLINYFGLMI